MEPDNRIRGIRQEGGGEGLSYYRLTPLTQVKSIRCNIKHTLFTTPRYPARMSTADIVSVGLVLAALAVLLALGDWWSR